MNIQGKVLLIQHLTVIQKKRLRYFFVTELKCLKIL